MIETTIEAGIGTVRLASPATANALTPAAFAELTAQILAVQRPDSGARVLVLTGSGKVFSAGANMDVLVAPTPLLWRAPSLPLCCHCSKHCKKGACRRWPPSTARP